MSPEYAVWARLRNLTPVTTLTGRIFLEKLPQSVTYPVILVSLIDDPRLYHLRGPSACGYARVQVDAMAKTASGYDARKAAEDLVVAITGDGAGTQATGLSGFKGAIGGSPDGVDILGIFQRDRTARFDPEELNVFTMSLEYQVEYRQM